MTDIVLPTVTTGYNISTINANFSKIQDALNDDVLRLSNGNNVLRQDVDFNGFRALNMRLGDLSAPVDANDAVRLVDLNTEAALRASADASLLQQIVTLQSSLNSGYIGYSTKALMDADHSKPINSVALVTNDPTTANNTSYRYDGSVWVAAVDRITLETNSRTAADAAIVSALALPSGSSGVGFLQAGTGAVSRTVQDKLRESLSVKDFGAVGNNIADDTVAIQTAINYCLANGTADLYFPPGKYKITAQLNVTFTGTETLNFRGAGQESSTIIVDYDTHNGFNISGPSGNWWVNNFPHYTLSFSDMSLLATRTNVGTGITMDMGSLVGRPSPQIYFNRFQIRSISAGQFNIGISLNNTNNVSFTGCRFIGSNGSSVGTHVVITADAGKDASGWRFTDCEFIYGFRGLYHTANCEGIYVTSCGFINNQEGIRGQAGSESGLIITNSEFDCVVYGIVESGMYDLTITGCCFLASGSNPASIGIWINSGNGFAISGCKISAYNIGINLSNTPAGLNRAGYVGGNSINSTPTAAVALSSCNSVLIADFASASVGTRVVNTTPGTNVRVTAP